MGGFRRKLIGGAVSVLALGGLSMGVGAGAAGASTFSVANTNASGVGSLTAAIAAANAHAGPDTITFAPNTNGHTIAEPGDDPAGDVTIQGNGRGVTIIGGEFNLNDTGGTATFTDMTVGDFNINTGAGTTTAVIRNVSVVTDGIDINSGFDGGHTTATLDHVTVTGGPGIDVNSGTHTSATITDSTVQNSTSDGIDINGDGTSVTIARSTVVHSAGVGIDVGGDAHVTMVNSTVFDSAEDAIDIFGAVTLQNDTLSGGGEGPVVAGNSGSLSITNTILDGVPANDGENGTALCSFDSTVVTSHGGNVAVDGTCRLTNAADHPNTNPHLGAFGANGGATNTMVPAAGSVAIDGGVASGCPSTDQRGVHRPQDGNSDAKTACDSGAVEIAGKAVAPTTTAAPVTTVPVTAASTPTTARAVAAAAAQLPRTGSSSLPLGVAGLVLVVAGAAIGLGARRRGA